LPGLRIGNWAITSYMYALLIVITIVSGTWTLLLSDLDLLMPILFFLFNLFLFLITCHVITTNPNGRLYILWAVILSAALQVVLIPFSFDELSRQTLFFNNPNQLGYWATISACLFLYIAQKEELSKLVYVIFTVLIFILAGLSLSKAAMISIIILYFTYYVKKPFVGIILLMGLSTAIIFASEVEQVSNIIDRISSIGASNDDNAAGRGYHRIWTEPENLIFGNGEGGLYRFDQSFNNLMGHHEIHSTMGMLFFSYGPIGIFIFIAIFVKLYFTRGMYSILPFLPLFAYGLTHQGFRFSFFWLLLGIVSTSYIEKVPLGKNLSKKTGVRIC